MAKINLSQNESKVLRVLIEDSRLSINEIAEVTGLNRNTVRKAIKHLISSQIIAKFTVEVKSGDYDNLVMIDTENIDLIPESERLEVFELSNGRFIVVSNLNVLKRNIRYTSVNVVRKIEKHSRLHEMVKVYCDYCGKEIREEAIILEHKNHQYYACCKNCEIDLRRKLAKVA